MAPDIDAAAARVLDALGISLVTVETTGCCGAIDHHLSAHEAGLERMRRNIDALWPHLEDGAEAVVVTASACAAMVKEYGELLADDPRYADRAQRVSGLARDLGEVIAAEDLAPLHRRIAPRRVAFHSPCTLQHAQKLPGLVEGILRGVGHELTLVPDGHLCCGSAGTYSVLQPRLSQQLLARKLAALASGQPELVATANIGCLTHLASGTSVPVMHWIRLLDPVAP
jgi:glycolate oxidase iron-sulfur subunit